MSGEGQAQGKGRARSHRDGGRLRGLLSHEPAREAADLPGGLRVGGEGNPDFPNPDRGAGPQPDPGARAIEAEQARTGSSSFDRQHYLDMFFDGLDDQDGQSFKGIYNEMSSGQFDVSRRRVRLGQRRPPLVVLLRRAGTATRSAQDMADFIGDSATAWFADATGTGCRTSRCRTT